MGKQLNKNPPDWRTVISGKRNNDGENSGSGIASTGLCIEWLQRIGLYAPPIACLQKKWKSGRGIGTGTGGYYTEGREHRYTIPVPLHLSSTQFAGSNFNILTGKENTGIYTRGRSASFFLAGSMESRTPVSIRQEINALLLIHPGSEYMTAAS